MVQVRDGVLLCLAVLILMLILAEGTFGNRKQPDVPEYGLTVRVLIVIGGILLALKLLDRF